MTVLITGKNSYIGEHIRSHLEKHGHRVDEADTVSDEWKELDLSRYDSIVHVAAIVHDNAKTASEDVFEKVNVELPLTIAAAAKQAGVKHFVFLSTMAVFGTDKSLAADKCVITADTPLSPVTPYGKTKAKAEARLHTLEGADFRIAVVRPPNVYGPGCRGNYIPLLKKLSSLMRLCPACFTAIRQSMLYIDNLSELCRLIIETNANGIHMPQDDVIPNTVELMTAIRAVRRQKTSASKFLGALVRLVKFVPIVRKIYGGVYYELALSDAFDNRYRLVSFEEGIAKTYQTP